MTDQTYARQLEDVQRAVVQFLRALENAQQHIRFQRIGDTQRELHESIGESLGNTADTLDLATPPADDSDLHGALAQSLVHMKAALQMFLSEASWPEFGAAFMSSRSQQCQALEILYRWRAELPLVEPYFRLPDTPAVETDFEGSASPGGPPVGILHRNQGPSHNNFSLYVPENYDQTRQWPLVVCLHGGHGRGDEYLWTWLRPARSRGYVVLSPKSIGPTWSIANPPRDVGSIVAMLDEVAATYTIDRRRIYLTGLSDGGTFSYLLGLEHADRFAGVAPIAGVLSPPIEPMLHAKQGIELPMHVIHGFHDAIFPVHTVRSTNKVLKSLGYDLTYTELPDWGHALTYAINEQLVLPWFERMNPATH